MRRNRQTNERLFDRDPWIARRGDANRKRAVRRRAHLDLCGLPLVSASLAKNLNLDKETKRNVMSRCTGYFKERMGKYLSKCGSKTG